MLEQEEYIKKWTFVLLLNGRVVKTNIRRTYAKNSNEFNNYFEPFVGVARSF